MTPTQHDLITLGVAPTVSAADLKQAYRTLAKRWHPDRFLDPSDKRVAEARLKTINLAYHRLKAHTSLGDPPPSLPPLDPPWSCVATWDAHYGSVRSLLATPDGRILLSAGDDGAIRLWNLRMNQAFDQLDGYHGAVRLLQLSGDGQLLCSYGDRDGIGIWHLGSASLLRMFRPAEHYPTPLTTLALSRDRQSLLGGTSRGQIEQWQTATGQLRHVLPNHQSAILNLSFNASGRCWISSSAEGVIKVHHTATQTLQQQLQLGTLIPSVLQISPDGTWLAVGGQRGELHLLPQIRRQTAQILRGPTPGHESAIAALAFDYRGHLLSASETGGIEVWRVADGVLLSRFSADIPIHAIATLKGNPYLFSAHSDGRIRVWHPGR